MVTRLLAALLLVCCAEAHAGYALVNPPVGVAGTTVGGSGSSLLTYARTAANNPWVNGSAAAQVTKTVGGRLVTMPVSMRMAANAGSFIAAAIRLNPSAIAITGIATVLAPLVWNAVSSTWERSGTGYCMDFNGGTCYAGAVGAIVFSTTEVAELYRTYLHDTQIGSLSAGCGGTWTVTGITASLVTVRRHVSCTNGATSDSDYTGHFRTISGVTQPATQSDWDTLAGKGICFDSLNQAYCFGDVVPNEWPSKVDPQGLPLPIEAPKIFPDALPWPQEMPYPVGDPVPVPGTSPQKYDQPYVGIRPSPTPADPWRVDENPGTWEGEDPAGLPEPDPDAVVAPGSTPEEQQTICDKDPEASACKHLDVPAGDALPVGTVNATLAADSGWGASDGACPSMVHTTLVGNVDVFGLFCTYLSGVRFLVIGFGGVMAVLIFLGRLD